MLKKLSMKTNFVLIGIIVGLFIGVTIKQVLGQATDGTARADNLMVNMSGVATNGLIVSKGNSLVANGSVGIGTLDPQANLDVVGDGLFSGVVTVQNGGRIPVGFSVSEGNVEIDHGSLSVGGGNSSNQFGFKVWGGNAIIIDKVGIGVANPVEKLDVQGSIRSAGYIKAESLCIGGDGTCNSNEKKLCIGSTCIDETQLKAMMSGGTVTGGTVTSGTMTGTGTTSDPYMCPIAYLAGVQSPVDCKNDSAIKQGCCPTGTITSCRAVAGGSSLVGTGCHYDPAPPQKHLEAAVDHGLEYILYAVAWQGAANRSALPVGSDCGSDNEFYHDPITVSGVPNTLIKFLPAAQCGDAGPSCFQGHRSTQACK